MSHLQRCVRLGGSLASQKLAKWSDMCEAAEVGVAIPGLDQTLIMWALRKELRGTGVEVYYNRSWPGVDLVRGEVRKIIPKPPKLYFDPVPRAFSEPVVEAIVPEINFHCRFDDMFAGREIEFAKTIIRIMKEAYENNLEI